MDFICSVKGIMLQFNDSAWQDILRRSSINQTSFTCLSIRPRNSCLFEDNEQTRSLQLWAYLYILFPKRNATSHWEPNIWLSLFWCESSMWPYLYIPFPKRNAFSHWARNIWLSLFWCELMLNNDRYLVVHVSLNNTEMEMLEERCTSTYTTITPLLCTIDGQYCYNRDIISSAQWV